MGRPVCGALPSGRSKPAPAARSPRHRRSGRRLDRPGDLRATAKLLSRFKLIWAVQSCSQKYFPLALTQITSISPAVSPHFEGRIAIVTDAGWDAMDAGGAADESVVLRTAKPCGPGTPTLVSSRRKSFRWRWWQESPVTKESAE